jgi:signal transduction histidine kinase
MKNIKKLSSELLKSYFCILGMFLIFNIILLSVFWKHLLNEAEGKIIIKLIKMFSIGGVFLLLLGLLRIKYFYNKFISQIIQLIETTDGQIEFVNNASHELKTPIFIIKGYVDLMKRWGLKDKEIALESLNAIQEEVKAMESLVEKLLFIAKNDKIKPVLEEVELSEVFIDILTEMKIVYPEQKFDFNSKEIKLYTDWALLKQLFRNIIDNAVKYGRGNLIKIFIEEESERVKVIIKDSGIGLTSEELEKIFDKFYRVDPSRNKNIKGHGLGLAISKTILEILDGKIKIESIPEVGTTVKIWIKKDKRQAHH